MNWLLTKALDWAYSVNWKALWQLRELRALLVVGAFAMGAATMDALEAAQDEAQAHADAGEIDEAFSTLSEANAKARGTLHEQLRVASRQAEAQLKRELQGVSTEDDLQVVMTRYEAKRAELRAAWARTYEHEILQLKAISWPSDQQFEVDTRIQLLEIKQRLLANEALEQALEEPSDPPVAAAEEGEEGPRSGFAQVITTQASQTANVDEAELRPQPEDVSADAPQPVEQGNPSVDLRLGE